MKASVYKKYGSPDVLKIEEVSKPIVLADEILIKVICSTVNRTDCGFRSAEYVISRLFSGLFKPKMQVLGSEFSGIVEEIGSEVTQFKVGDRVFGFDDKKFGGHAEYKTIGENKSVATIPEGIDFEEAAAILEGSHYALCDIFAAKVQKGQKVLVNGSTGAIGSSAVQLLKHHFGAEVTAVCGTENQELVKSLGADYVIDFTKENYTNTTLKYDFVFDAVGKSSFGEAKKVLKENGIYISTELGKGGQNVYLALWTPFFSKKKLLFPLPTINKKDTLFIKSLVETNQFRPLIDRNFNFTLDQIIEATKYVETGQKIGNVVLKIA
jgi:NADPH:quinone reductase-like Zn-dependent oxidoreductase